jgi:hypothetical protein
VDKPAGAEGADVESFIGCFWCLGGWFGLVGCVDGAFFCFGGLS